ncbi:MAG: hypothetical protein RTU09_06380 [Candidatus Thorarchaeota archaeon]
MQRKQFKFLFILGIGMLVVSGMGPTPAFIESDAELNTYNHKIQPDDHAPKPMEQVPQCPAETRYYLEDFTTTTYQDSANTNVSDWGNGNLRLPRKTPTLAGSYNTPNLAFGVFVSGDYAYVADRASGLQVINITNPLQPSLAGSCNTPYLAYDVFVSGDYAYVADSISGLQVINITNPSQPSLASSYDTPGDARGVFVNGDYAYVADVGWGLQVINITNPLQPSLAGSYNTPSFAYGVFVSGNYAFVADSSSGLQVINIINPSQPSLAGSYDTSGQALGVFVSGDYAYIADDTSGLQVINITNPSQPSLAGAHNTPDNALGVFVCGDYAYIADDTSGLQVINITNPLQPSLAGSYDTPGAAFAVVVSGDYAYVADWFSGLQVIKIADYITPSSVGSYNTPNMALSVFVSGDYAYVADWISGLQVINITNPSQPSLAGSYGTLDHAFSVFVSGDYAYVAIGSLGLQVINVTDPSQLSPVGSYNTPSMAYDVYVSGDYAFVADVSSGLQVINITDPSQPSLADSYNTPDRAFGVFVSGDYAYVADGDSGLQVINITDPSHLSLAASYDTPDEAYNVFVSGDYAYVADYDSGLQVINITNPSQPSLAGSYNTPNAARDVFVNGDYAYVADMDSGLQVINVTDPSHPSPASSYNTPHLAHGVYVSGDYAYVADGTSGLQVVEVMWRRWRQFESLAVAQSLLVFDAISTSVVSATLSVQQLKPPNTLVNYYLSADNGSHWESVIPDVEHIFVHRGGQFVWKAVLSTSHSLVAPTASSLAITYVSQLDAPILLAPVDGMSINDNAPTFEWTMVSGAASYLLQLDRVTSFDSVNLINTTVVSLTYSPSSALEDGMWFWRVVAKDIVGDWGVFSSTRSLDIETGLPVWDQTPSSQVCELGLPFWYDLNASDPSGLDQWWINDTARFAVDGAGVITNTTRLSVDQYGLQVWVNDTYNNILTGVFTISVQDTTAPTWDQTPSHQSIAFGERLRYDLNASDLSGIHYYWINDTTHFTIDSNGLISDAQNLAIDIYWLEVRAYDPYGYYCGAIFNVTVHGVIPDTQPPTWVTTPTNQVLEYGVLLDYQLAASDPSGLDAWWLNDTANFNIGSNGRIISIGVLTSGVFGVRIFVNDTYGNVLIDTFTVIVEDTTSPTWVQTPTSQTLEFGDMFFYDVDAFDLSGIDHYWVNETTHFTIDENGCISNATTLAVGIYWIEVRAYDPYDRYCSATFVVTVEEPTPTPTEPSPLMLPVIAIGSFIGGAAIVGIGTFMFLRHRKKPP